MSDEKKNPDLPPDGIVEKLDFKLEQAKKFKDQFLGIVTGKLKLNLSLT